MPNKYIDIGELLAFLNPSRKLRGYGGSLNGQ